MILADNPERGQYIFQLKPLSIPRKEEVTARIEKCLREWEGTRYMQGQGCKGKATDCLRFFIGFLTEAQDYRKPEFNNVPQDASLHNKKIVMEVVRQVIKIYGPCEKVFDTKAIEPGDFIVTGPKNGGPGHVIIVGTKQGHLWEATHTNVRQSGMLISGVKVFRIYRALNKNLWFS
jgi:cell wall-associated NlpC family hydrolase